MHAWTPFKQITWIRLYNLPHYLFLKYKNDYNFLHKRYRNQMSTSNKNFLQKNNIHQAVKSINYAYKPYRCKLWW